LVCAEVPHEVPPNPCRLIRTRISRDEKTKSLAVGEIEPPLSCDKKLPSYRRLGIVKRHLQTRRCRDFRCPETRWATADYSKLSVMGQGQQSTCR